MIKNTKPFLRSQRLSRANTVKKIISEVNLESAPSANGNQNPLIKCGRRRRISNEQKLAILQQWQAHASGQSC
jgi:hypothetical protein